MVARIEQTYPCPDVVPSPAPNEERPNLKKGGTGRSTFANLRAESHWHLRTLLEQGQIALPHDEELFDELAAIRWRATSNGKIQVEPKEDLKNRLGRSPDRADAVVLAFSAWAPRKARSTEAVHWG